MQQFRQTERYTPQGYVPITHEGLDAVVYIGQTETLLKGTVLCGAAYRGRALKPEWNYIFRNEAQRDHTITEFFASVAAQKDRKEKRITERKLFRTILKPGDILDTCWGYDQTNVEFYQVLTVHNNTVTIQEVCQDYKETGYMCGHTMPIPNKSATEPQWKDGIIIGRIDAPILTKRISPGESVRINESVTASKWDGQQCYTSSYA